MNSGKKILFVITKATWGGAQKYVLDLALAARESGHDVAVAYGEPGELARRLEALGVRRIEIAGLTRDVRAGSDAGAFAALKAVFEAEKPGIVHLNSAKAAGLGALAARIARVPMIIFTAHGWAFNEQRPVLERAVIWLLSGLTVLLAHETICVSHAVARDIARFPLAAKKLRVIHNGINCTARLPRAVAREKLAPQAQQGFWIGMASELHPTKRVGDAIEAFAKIVPVHPEALLIVLGEGEERARLEDLIVEKGLAGRVVLAGFMADAAQYFSAFDIFLHASKSEALAYAVLEAGCASLPVVATRVGGIPEIVEDGVSGLLVPPQEPGMIALALENLIARPEKRAAYGRALAQRVAREFSKHQMLEETLKCYA